MLSESARMSSAAEARFRVQGSLSTSRALNVVALDPASGQTIVSEPIGSVPSQFTSPAAGAGRIVVGAEGKVLV